MLHWFTFQRQNIIKDLSHAVEFILPYELGNPPPPPTHTHTHICGVLNRDGGLIHITQTMVLVLHRELENKAEKFKYKKLEVMWLRIKNKSELPVGK